jgi:hypothetical protein
MQADIHVLSGIRTHDHSVRAVEKFHALDLAATVIDVRVISGTVLTIQFGYWQLFGGNRGARIEGRMNS